LAQIDYTELKESFVNSSLSILSKLESYVLVLETSIDKNAINELFRGIHTIKGNSGIFQLEKIPALSHAFENVLNLLRNDRLIPNPDLIDLMLLAIDRLKEMITTLAVSDLVEVSDLVDKFNSYLTTGSDRLITKDAEIIERPNLEEKSEWMEDIKLSEKVITFAKSKKKYLSIVVVNLSVQSFNFLSEFIEKLKSIQGKVRILRRGLVEKKILPLDTHEHPKVPYYLIILSDNKVENFLKEEGLILEFVSTVVVPENMENVYVRKETEANKPEPEKTPPKQSASPSVDSDVNTSINVNLNLLNNLINLTGEIVLARNVLALKIQQSGNPELEIISKRFEKLLSELESGILKTRLQSLSLFFQKIPRLIRDISKTTGKQIEVAIEGNDVELDKALIDQLGDPITHIIRNAIDHGIESKEERESKGKTPWGNLRVAARLNGGNVEIIISDDGKGLNTEKIKEKVIQKNLANYETVSKSSNEELVEYLFLPGFSTSNAVTNLSGRGVGLDVVRSNLKKVGGTVSIEFEVEKGTTFILSIPQTLSIVTCLIVKSANRKFAIPQHYLSELIRINPTKIKSIDNKKIYNLRNQFLPFANIGSIFHLEEKSDEKAHYIVSLKSEKFYFGIAIEEVLDREDIVVKPLGEYFEELSFFSGATILGDGDIALILDVSGLARLAGMQAQAKLIESIPLKEITNQSDSYLLFSIGKSRIAMSIQTNPYIVKVSQKEILNSIGLDRFLYNKTAIPILWLNEILNIEIDIKSIQTIPIILYKHKSGYIGIAATHVEGVVTDLENIQSESIVGEGILGTGYRDGESILLLDTDFILDEFYHKKLKNLKLKIEENKEIRSIV